MDGTGVDTIYYIVRLVLEESSLTLSSLFVYFLRSVSAGQLVREDSPSLSLSKTILDPL